MTDYVVERKHITFFFLSSYRLLPTRTILYHIVDEKNTFHLRSTSVFNNAKIDNCVTIFDYTLLIICIIIY